MKKTNRPVKTQSKIYRLTRRQKKGWTGMDKQKDRQTHTDQASKTGRSCHCDKVYQVAVLWYK